MLLVISGIMLCVNTIVCAIPLFSTFALQASLSNALTGGVHPYPRTLQLGADTYMPSTGQIVSVGGNLNQDMTQTFGALTKTAPELSVNSYTYALYLSQTDAQSQADPVEIRILSAAPDVLRQHVTLLRGAFPAMNTGQAPFQIAISEATATSWHVALESTVYLSYMTQAKTQRVLPVRVVGIATASSDDPTLGNNFSSSLLLGQNLVYPVLGSLDATLALAAQTNSSNEQTDSSAFSYLWTYQLSTDQIQPAQVPTLLTSGAGLAGQLQTANVRAERISSEYIAEDDFLTTLGIWQFRVALFQAPILTLVIELLACVVFCLSILGEYVVAWQFESLTTLQSRGLDGSRIFWSIGCQALLLGVITLPLSLLCAITSVIHFSNAILPSTPTPHTVSDVVALAWSVIGYAVGSVAVMTGAIFVATAQIARKNVLDARREQSRASRKPLWQYLYLDILFLLLGGSGTIVYHQVDQSLDSSFLHTNQFVFALTILGPLLLTVGVGLLMARLFPLILHLCALLVGLYPGSIPILAIARLARAPRQATTMMLLMAMAFSLSSLTIITLATEQQHVSDVATLNVGTDFQGVRLDGAPESLGALERMYRAVSGARATSAGTSYAVQEVVAGTNSPIVLDVLAMDTHTFGATAYWPAQDHDIVVSSLMHALQKPRSLSGNQQLVPVIVDAETWNALGLSLGREFHLALPGYTNTALLCIVVGEVPYLPSVQPSSATGAGDSEALGGVLADYQVLKTAYTHDIPNNDMRLDTVWVRAEQNSHALTSVRAILTSGELKLTQLQDRWALIRQYQQDPIQNDLLYAQILVALTSITLAVLLILYDVWFVAHRQQRDSAFLHAFGASSSQLWVMRLCERTFLLIISLALGLGSAALLTPLLEPVMAFTQLISGDGAANVTAFDIPPVRIVVPDGWLAMALGVVIAVIWVGSVYFSGRQARNATREALRLNQD